MSPERELKRHVKVLEDIQNASNKEELPNVTLSSIAKYLASNASFDKVHISQTAFKPVTDALAKYNYFSVPEVKEAFMQVLRENYEGKTEEEYEALYTQISEGTSIGNYLVEIQERAKKLEQFEQAQDLENHKLILKQIKNAFEIKELPSVGRGILNRRTNGGSNWGIFGCCRTKWKYNSRYRRWNNRSCSYFIRWNSVEPFFKSSRR